MCFAFMRLGSFSRPAIMQRATNCVLRHGFVRVLYSFNVGNAPALIYRVNSSLLCRKYTVLPPSQDKEEKAMLDSMLRVDHAGEYGANRIYAGQMAVLGRTQSGPIIQDMWDQEKMHLQKFNEILGENRVRPTILLPLWNVAGFLLGASTALLGKEGAMACTVAVEESISEHYNSQIRALMDIDPERYTELLQLIKEFRDDELEHQDTGLEHDAESVPGYLLLKAVIQAGCKAAIYMSQRI